MAKAEEIEQRTLNIIGKVFKKDPATLSRDTYLIRDLLAKSMNFLELQVLLEAEFNVDLPSQEVMKAESAGKLIDLIAAAL